MGTNVQCSIKVFANDALVRRNARMYNLTNFALIGVAVIGKLLRIAISYSHRAQECRRDLRGKSFRFYNSKILQTRVHISVTK